MKEDISPDKIEIENLQKENAKLRADKENIEAYLNNIIQIVPASIYWKDINSVLLGGNLLHAKIAGLKCNKDVVGKTDYDFIWKNQAKRIIENDKMIMRYKQGLKLEEEATLSDGKIHTFLTSKAPMFNKHHKVIGVIGASLDITELKETQEKLKRAKEAADMASIAKTEFIANMSHDIRTPLSGVVGLGEIVEKQIIDLNLKSKVHDMVKSANELLNMLNEILDVISLGNISVEDINEETFDLPYLVQSVIDLEKSSIDLKKIELSTSIDEEIPAVLLGDHKKLHHIILNLVGNAIKFTKKGYVQIGIKLVRKDIATVQLLFEIKDTGMGIPEDSLEKIFDLFYKITPSYKGLDKGYGLGLHIVKTYVELLGGKVSVESKLNQGSKFSFTLTLKIADQNAKPQNIVQPQSIFTSNQYAMPFAQKRSGYPPAIGPEKLQDAPEVLVVEDNPVILSLIETLLKDATCNSTPAIDGESALELAKTKHFDLILSDVGLPGISGIEFAKLLRQYEREHQKKPVPIVAVTGHGQAVQKECLEAGMNFIIVKPIRPETIADICSKFALFGEEANISSSQKVGKLGPDVPNTEAELLEIDELQIFVPEDALQYTHLANLIDLLKVFISDKSQHDIQQIKLAYSKKDWDQVTHLAHKIKGAAVTLGLKRMHIAALNLEQLNKTTSIDALDKLYYQFLSVNDVTVETIKKWLKTYD